jgi:TRAP-type uncharacterized transport system substrate-binding protein
VAYAITRALFEQRDRLVSIHPALKQMTIDYTLGASPIPLHEGTVRYLREAGYDVPDALLP